MKTTKTQLRCTIRELIKEQASAATAGPQLAVAVDEALVAVTNAVQAMKNVTQIANGGAYHVYLEELQQAGRWLTVQQNKMQQTQ